MQVPRGTRPALCAFDNAMCPTGRVPLGAQIYGIDALRVLARQLSPRASVRKQVHPSAFFYGFLVSMRTIRRVFCA